MIKLIVLALLGVSSVSGQQLNAQTLPQKRGPDGKLKLQGPKDLKYNSNGNCPKKSQIKFFLDEDCKKVAPGSNGDRLVGGYENMCHKIKDDLYFKFDCKDGSQNLIYQYYIDAECQIEQNQIKNSEFKMGDSKTCNKNENPLKEEQLYFYKLTPDYQDIIENPEMLPRFRDGSKKDMDQTNQIKIGTDDMTVTGKTFTTKDNTKVFTSQMKGKNMEQNTTVKVGNWTDKNGKQVNQQYLEVIQKFDKYFMYAIDQTNFKPGSPYKQCSTSKNCHNGEGKYCCAHALFDNKGQSQSAIYRCMSAQVAKMNMDINIGGAQMKMSCLAGSSGAAFFKQVLATALLTLGASTYF